jgi:hypothetical protein
MRRESSEFSTVLEVKRIDDECFSAFLLPVFSVYVLVREDAVFGTVQERAGDRLSRRGL